MPVWTESRGASQLSSAREAGEGERGAGPSLARSLGLAQRLALSSKAPEHASQTPPFTAWLAGPHPHTQPDRMLLKLAHQVTGERAHIAPS